MHYFQFEIKEWVTNVAHLTLEEEAAYLRLCLYYYDSERPISDLAMVFRKCRIPADLGENLLREFFTCIDGAWMHKRCDAELARFKAKHEQASRAGKAPVGTPDGVCESVWSDFVALRKAKKAKITQTALNGLEREARKAQIPLEDALRICCERGWAGFKADWIASHLSQPKDKNLAAARAIFGDERRLNDEFKALT